MGKAPETKSFTLYRLVGDQKLRSFIQDKYFKQGTMDSHIFVIEGRTGLFVKGAIKTDEAKWVKSAKRLTGVEFTQGNVTSVGLIIIPSGREGIYWALSFGMGFQLLDKTYVDYGFGQRIAIRTVDPAVLKSVSKTTIDQRAKTERASIPSGESVFGFDVGGYGEVVTRIKGAAQIPELTVGQKTVQVRGSDSLSIRLGTDKSALIADLDVLESILERDPVPELAEIDQLAKIKDKELIEILDNELVVEIENGGGKFGLFWPDDRIENNDSPSAWKVLGANKPGLREGDPELEDIIEILQGYSPDQRIKRMKTAKIQLFDNENGDNAISSAVPIRRWLTFEYQYKGKRYCLHNGDWFEMSSRYAEKLQHRTERLFQNRFEIDFPIWKIGEPEKDYNLRLAQQVGGVCLDRDLIRTDAHPRGIEPADVVLDGNTLIHVKQFDSSSPASHLIAQALVSEEAIYDDENAWNKLKEKLLAQGVSPEMLAEKPENVVLAIARTDRQIAADDLFSFTQVTLNDCVKRLQGRGRKVYIVPIQRGE
ncbi:DUF6119 family protein [Corynebacterium sp. H130]|uniref:DUF6119 family protein n=1 Tax=Corynebacterium sp. H130 TaxID=3133444 RepID=UPI0030A633B3